MKFEWDISKAELNIKKHSVDFDEAVEALNDEFGLDAFDEQHSDISEYRYSRIGLSSRGVLFVIYAVRDECEIYRIISAERPKTRKKNYIGNHDMSEEPKEFILEVTEEDYQSGLRKGWTEDDMLPVGKHKFRRVSPERRATKADLQPSNIKVEFQMKLDLDVLKYFQKRAETGEIEALQLLLNERLRAAMEGELKLEEVETKLLKDKKFIAALAEEVKKAA